MTRSAHLMLCIPLLAGLVSGCGKNSKEDPSAELPVANNWNGQAQVGASAGADPHAGVDMGAGADPHAGLDMGGADPHAGLNMGAGADPHAGLDMGNGNPGGLAAPDPNRAVDPKMFVKGSMRAADSTKDLIKPGAILFLSVRPINTVTGESLGAPLAVERMDLKSLPVDFHLSGAQSMVAGTKFEGDVVVYARIDGDGEASSTLPGDIEGRVQATIPAEGLELVLDTIVK